MNKATYKMHYRLIRTAYEPALLCSGNCLAPSLVDASFLQTLWNLRYVKVDLLGYYQKYNVSAFRRYVAN